MAVDRKSQHVGNHGGVYNDIDGQTKQFTYIDHDKNTTRLKIWKEATPKTEEITPEIILLSDITSSGILSDPLFIKLFDDEIASKYEFQRFKAGQPVEHLKDDNRKEEGWYKDLERIYKIALTKHIERMQKFLKQKYEL